MLGNDWDLVLKDELDKDYFKELLSFVKTEYKNKTIYPKKNEIFNAFRHTSYADTRVVILGQDPYHGENEAEGLSFSVKTGIRKPPSLNNIFKELNDDLGIPISTSGSLLKWADEGVLLLNSVLTVEKDKAASHQGKGWEEFTDAVIKKLNEKKTPIVFILWGSYARSKKSLITNKEHYIIESAHPSPFSAYNGFFGSRPFSKTNNFLRNKGLKEIDWDLTK
jgi:uracil-DNA glycosylase